MGCHEINFAFLSNKLFKVMSNLHEIISKVCNISVTPFENNVSKKAWEIKSELFCPFLSININQNDFKATITSLKFYKSLVNNKKHKRFSFFPHKSFK